ncbi:stage II sporulation protein R [Oscillospiraceae bacterium WX1]
MKLKKWEIALIAALVITFLCGAALSKEDADLSEKLIRLHVVANSDTDDDQALKLKVRDTILVSVADLLDGVTDRDAAVKIIQEHLPEIITNAKQTVAVNGYSYDVTATIGLENFPTRVYDSFSLPAGTYMSLRVIIGAGAGHNWWCVIFPPLCTSAAVDFSKMTNLTDDEIQLISSDKPEYVLKFKSIELINKIRAWLGI